MAWQNNSFSIKALVRAFAKCILQAVNVHCQKRKKKGFHKKIISWWNKSLDLVKNFFFPDKNFQEEEIVNTHSFPKVVVHGTPFCRVISFSIELRLICPAMLCQPSSFLTAGQLLLRISVPSILVVKYFQNHSV